MRKLLPYEHALIDALGITEEEYFLFRKAQQEYNDIKEGTIFDARNGTAVAALIVAAVGVLFQVGAALLAPKPNIPTIDIPDVDESSSQVSRRIAPRSSFNTIQSLADYGQTITLIYANSAFNSSGGVRVNTVLLRSAVYSFGRNQYVQLMAAVGAGDIGPINPRTISFGQTLITQLPSETIWIYESRDKIPTYNEKRFGNNSDPGRQASASNENVYGMRAWIQHRPLSGYTQAFSPPSSLQLGLTEPIPLKEKVVVRKKEGTEDLQEIRNRGDKINSNRFNIRFKRVDYGAASSGSADARSNEVLDQIVQSLEIGSLYKLGSTKARLINILGGYDVTKNDVIAEFKRVSGYPVFKSNYDRDKIAKITDATYTTVSPVSHVTFCFKARVFMNVQGRRASYGSEVSDSGFNEGENGDKYRTAMFIARYRELGSTRWETSPGIFCVRRSTEAETYFSLSFNAGIGPVTRWEFMFEPVIAPDAEMERQGAQNIAGSVAYHYIESAGVPQGTGSNSKFRFIGTSRASRSDSDKNPPINTSPKGLDEWTISSLRSDTILRTSFDSGPEFSIVSVTEQQNESYPSGLYENMTLLGVNAFSGPGLTELRSLSAFVDYGKKIRSIGSKGYAPLPNVHSNKPPEIFLDTLLDDKNGIGQYINTEGIDIDRLYTAKVFCETNEYFMDGVIASQQPWRQFWAEVAPYSLLELAKIGGKETLVPAVPYDQAGNKTRQVQISALFNQGNILDGSYKEDFIDYGDSSQDLIATVIFRNQDRINNRTNPFPKNDTVEISRRDTKGALAIRKTFDVSDFVTRRQQAIDYGKLLVQQQRHVRRLVEFQTFPTEAPIEPGSYIYVQIDDNNWDNIHSGQVLDDGSINIPFAMESISGTFDTLVYVPGKEPTKHSVSYSKGQSSFFNDYAGTGALFVLGRKVSAKRVFRVISISMAAEGEVTVSAVEHPCEESGGNVLSKVANFSDELFKIS